MFIFKSSFAFTVAFAIIFKYTSAASLPESDNSPVVDVQTNDGPVREDVRYDLHNDQVTLNQPSASGDNSTDHMLEPVKGWFYRAVDFVENAFTGMLDKSTSFVKGFEEKNTDDDKSFWNRSSQVIEVFGQKFLKVRTVEKKITNNSIAYIEKEVIKPLTAA